MQIVVDNLLVGYQLVGSGRLVLLLHGWGDNLKNFSDLQKELSGNYKVLAVDLPGFGTSQPPGEAWGLGNYATFIRNLLSKLQLSKLYAVIGHSNGGAIAIYAVSKGDLDPEKLVLLAASGIRNQQASKRKVMQTVAKLGRAATFWLPSSKRTALRKKLYGTIGSDLLVAPGMEDSFKKIIRQDVQINCKNISQPTLLVYGDADHDTPVAYGELYHKLIHNSKLRVVSAGHFVHLDQKDQVFDEIRKFLQ